MRLIAPAGSGSVCLHDHFSGTAPSHHVASSIGVSRDRLGAMAHFPYRDFAGASISEHLRRARFPSKC